MCEPHFLSRLHRRLYCCRLRRGPRLSHCHTPLCLPHPNRKRLRLFFPLVFVSPWSRRRRRTSCSAPASLEIDPQLSAPLPAKDASVCPLVVGGRENPKNGLGVSAGSCLFCWVRNSAHCCTACDSVKAIFVLVPETGSENWKLQIDWTDSQCSHTICFPLCMMLVRRRHYHETRHVFKHFGYVTALACKALIGALLQRGGAEPNEQGGEDRPIIAQRCSPGPPCGHTVHLQEVVFASRLNDCDYCDVSDVKR